MQTWGGGIWSAYHLHGIFGWDFWDKWNSLFLSVKTAQNTMLYHLSVELGRLGRLVQCSQSRRPWVKEWHEWDFCKRYSLSQSFRLKRKEEYLQRHSSYSGKFSPGRTVPFDISSEKKGFLVQMVSAHGKENLRRRRRSRRRDLLCLNRISMGVEG